MIARVVHAAVENGLMLSQLDEAKVWDLLEESMTAATADFLQQVPVAASIPDHQYRMAGNSLLVLHDATVYAQEPVTACYLVKALDMKPAEKVQFRDILRAAVSNSAVGQGPVIKAAFLIPYASLVQPHFPGGVSFKHFDKLLPDLLNIGEDLVIFWMPVNSCEEADITPYCLGLTTVSAWRSHVSGRTAEGWFAEIPMAVPEEILRELTGKNAHLYFGFPESKNKIARQAVKPMLLHPENLHWRLIACFVILGAAYKRFFTKCVNMCITARTKKPNDAAEKLRLMSLAVVKKEKNLFPLGKCLDTSQFKVKMLSSAYTKLGRYLLAVMVNPTAPTGTWWNSAQIVANSLLDSGYRALLFEAISLTAFKQTTEPPITRGLIASEPTATATGPATRPTGLNHPLAPETIVVDEEDDGEVPAMEQRPRKQRRVYGKGPKPSAAAAQPRVTKNVASGASGSGAASENSSAISNMDLASFFSMMSQLAGKK
jgi:hypothetical protein